LAKYKRQNPEFVLHITQKRIHDTLLSRAAIAGFGAASNAPVRRLDPRDLKPRSRISIKNRMVLIPYEGPHAICFKILRFAGLLQAGKHVGIIEFEKGAHLKNR
jgi:hypothetical protein